MALEVANHAVDDQAVVLGDELAGSVLEGMLRDVQWDVAPQRPRSAHRTKEDPGLLGRARPELDELAGTGGLDDLIRAALEDLTFGAGGVVLGQLADLIE